MDMATIKDDSIGALVGDICKRAKARGLHYGVTYRTCHSAACAWLTMANDNPLRDGLKRTLVSQLANAHNLSISEARLLVYG